MNTTSFPTSLAVTTTAALAGTSRLATALIANTIDETLLKLINLVVTGLSELRSGSTWALLGNERAIRTIYIRRLI